jgi:hypothetical protein
MADTVVKYGISLENGTPTLDFTLDPVDNNAITAADTFSMLIPAGTVLNGYYSVITTATGTTKFVGSISIGVTSHTTDIASSVTPSTTLGGTLAALGTTTYLGIANATTYLVVTVNSTNAITVTGKLKVKVGLGLSSGQPVVL